MASFWLTEVRQRGAAVWCEEIKGGCLHPGVRRGIYFAAVLCLYSLRFAFNMWREKRSQSVNVESLSGHCPLVATRATANIVSCA